MIANVDKHRRNGCECNRDQIVSRGRWKRKKQMDCGFWDALEAQDCKIGLVTERRTYYRHSFRYE